MIPGGVIYDYPEFRNDFLPWLKFSMVEARHQEVVKAVPIIASYHEMTNTCWTVRPVEAQSQAIKPSKRAVGGMTFATSRCRKFPTAEHKVGFNLPIGSFPFLRLGRSIRDRIYRYILLPPSKRVHPYIKSWYDLTTRAIFPVFLTCKQMHDEAESVLYGQGIFTSLPLQKYEKRLCQFLGGRLGEPGTGLNPRLLTLIKHLSFGWHKVGQHRIFSIIAKSMQLEHLELVLSTHDVEYMNSEWLHRAINPKALWRAGHSGDFAMVSYDFRSPLLPC